MAPVTKGKKNGAKAYTHQIGNEAKIRDGLEKRRGAPKKKNKMKDITNDKELGKYVGGKINAKIDKGAGSVKKGADKAIGYVGNELKKSGADKNLVDYGMKRVGRGAGELIRQGSGAAKKWIHNEGKQALQRGAQEIGNKVKKGWEDFKSKFRR